jgi:enoyl-CoA hydratase/carnithine racemase
VTDTAPATAHARGAAGQGTAPRGVVRVDHPAPPPFGQGLPDPGVALVTIDRREALNALDAGVMAGLADAFARLDADSACRVIVLTGAGTRAFAAGADIKAMASATPATIGPLGGFEHWATLAGVGLPVIAAVRGFALGGGCELALLCDVVVAADDATFGQPEITLGVIPGAGGTQRLTRSVGKARAMDLILTGRSIDAREAERIGIVSRIVPAKETLDRALELAGRIASLPPLAVRAAKAAVNAAQELPLSEGLARERQAFFSLFATEDQKEGMAAFVGKRSPRWTGR